jgi:hypothetical protein
MLLFKKNPAFHSREGVGGINIKNLQKKSSPSKKFACKDFTIRIKLKYKEALLLTQSSGITQNISNGN